MSDTNKGTAGEVKYVIRADDSRIEQDLEQANRKVEKATKQSADEINTAWKTIDTDIDITVDADTGKAENEIKSISKDKNIEVDIEADASKARDEIESLEDTGEEVSKSLREKLGEAFKDLAGGDVGTLIQNIGGAAKESFGEAATSTLPLAGKISELTAGLSGTAIAAIGIGAAAAGAGAIAVNAADDMKGAMDDFLAATGKGCEETERYQGILENIYANNYGEDFHDIADAMAEVREQVGPVVDSWDDTKIQEFTESAFALRDTFEYDVSESVRTANTLMEQFGIDGQQAFNLIASGAQNGLDFSGELLDSINEYSVHFEKVGLDADDMFKIFQKGADTGAFNLDKVGDAVKEMSIRVLDGSETTQQGFELLGLDADKMAEKFAAGGDMAKEAFEQTLDALASMEDPIEQNTAGVDLFGTMWEDLGADAVTALSDIEEGAYNTSDAMEQIKEVKYDDLGSMLETLQRNVELLLVPIGEALIPILSLLIESILPAVQNLLSPLIELFAQLLVPIVELIGTALEPLIEIFGLLIDVALLPLMEVAKLVVSTVVGVIEGMATDIIWHVTNIKNIFKEIIDFIKNVFTGNWEAAWQNVKNIFSNIISGFSKIFKTPMNFIIDGINGFIKGINNIKIPDWVPVVGGTSFKLKTIPRLKVGMDYVPSDMYPAFLDEGEWVLTKEEANALRSLGGIEGMISLLDDALSSRNIVVENNSDIDYNAMGEAVYEAFRRHGMGISVDKREFGRVIEEILEERG